MNLLLITGAGASRALGVTRPMPLMADWSDALCDGLDAAMQNLAPACGLRRSLQGDQFEEIVGALLQLERTLPMWERFGPLGGPQAGSEYGEAQVARKNTAQRLNTIKRVINETLYDQFGQHRVDDSKARDAYQSLLGELRVDDLVVATTNYDRAGESALTELGHSVDVGFPSTGYGRTPVLDVTGMMDRRGTVPYLHLHGAVGWYEADGVVRDKYADEGFNEVHGRPVVLYPDPNKDPTNDAMVSDIWREFRSAFSRCDHVLVLGHSLHDPALVRTISEADPAKLAVSYYSDDELGRISSLLPRAIPIKIEFGPELTIDRRGVAAFRG